MSLNNLVPSPGHPRCAGFVGGLAIVVASTALGIQPAHAATTSHVSVFGDTLAITSAVGGNNSVTLVATSNANHLPIIRVSEGTFGSGSFTTAAPCIQTSAKTVECPADAIASYVISTGDGNDTVSTRGVDLPGSLAGGAGNDTLSPGPGAQSLAGGSGIDTAAYAARAADVTVSIDGVANDGEYREGDNVGLDVENVTGGAGNDSITGSGGANVLSGGPGDDTVNGAGGADVLSGNDGTDTATYVQGGGARQPGVNVSLDDVKNDGASGEYDNVRSDIENVIGGRGNDTLAGTFGPNVLDGGGGADLIRGGSGSDTVSYAKRTTSVTVTLDGQANDGVAGETDNVSADVENIVGGSGNDKLTGSKVANRIDGGKGADVFIGLDGIDTVTYATRTAAVQASIGDTVRDGEAGELDVVRGDIENLVGGQAADVLTGNGSFNRLEGGAGPDTLLGGGFNDVLLGGPGSDTLDGGDGSDTASYADKTEAVQLNLDGFTNDGTPGEADTIKANVENLTGGAGADTLTGNAGPNVLDGGLGTDQLVGGAGADTVTYSSRLASIKASNEGSANDGYEGEHDQIAEDVENLTGGSGDDTLTIVGGAGKLSGGKGDDELKGAAGHDRLSGGDGDDLLFGMAGTDAYDGGAGTDTVTYGGEREDVTADIDGVADDGVAGEGENLGVTIENITGGYGDDLLVGNGSPNVLDGGGGHSDVLHGLGGHDTLQLAHVAWGGEGADTILLSDIGHGQDGNDTITGVVEDLPVITWIGTCTGGAGNDTLTECRDAKGEGGDDKILAINGDGGPGNDTLEGLDFESAQRGGPGADIMKAPGVAMYSERTAAVTVTEDGLANDGEANEHDMVGAMRVIGGGGNDSIKAPGYQVAGGAGDDQLTGFLIMFGGQGNDTMRLNPGNVDREEYTQNELYGGGGNDTLYGADYWDDLLFGESGNDVLKGLSGVDELSGGSGNDVLEGGDHPDQLAGGPGADVIKGGAGRDELHDYLTNVTPVWVSQDGVANDGSANEHDNIGADIEWFGGGAGDDELTGSSIGNHIWGGAGHDTVDGGLGDDHIYGGLGTDLLYGSAGDDHLDGEEGPDHMDGGDGYDLCAYDGSDFASLYCESTGPD